MNRSGLFGALLVAFAVTGLTVAQAPAVAATLNKAASLTNVNGTVDVQRADSGDWIPAVENMKVYGGDSVRTQAQSSVMISWSGGNVVRLASFTSFAIKDMTVDLASKAETSSFEVGSGNVYARAKELTNPESSFEVATPSAVAGIRGTTFGTGVAAGASTFTCPDGDVHIRGMAGGEQMCKTGTFVFVPPGAPPEPPQDITLDMMEEFNQEIEEFGNPTLTVLSPTGDGETSRSTINVTFRTEPGNSAAVNGAAVDVSEAGQASRAVELEEGDNEIKIEVVNEGGKTASAFFLITYAPVEAVDEPVADLTLSVSAPQNGAEFAADKVTVRGTTTGTAVAVGAVNAQVDANGAFSAQITLQEGENNIIVAATDGEDSVEVNLQLFFYPELPLCEAFFRLINPRDGLLVGSTSVPVAAEVPMGAEVDISGNMFIASTGRISGNLPLIMEGENNFEVGVRVKRTDCIETTVGASFSVRRDTMGPRINIQRPSEGFIPTGEIVSIVLTVTDESDIQRFEINGIDRTAGLDESGVFKGDIRISRDVRSLVIRAADVVGNASEATVTRGTLENVDATELGVGSIRVVVNPMMIRAGESADVEVYIGSLDGKPAPKDIPLNLFANMGRFEPPSGFTDGVRGVSEPFKFIYRSPASVMLRTSEEMQRGSVKAQITVEALSRQVVREVEVIPAGGFPVILTAGSMSLMADGRDSTAVAASVNVGGRPAAGVPVTFTVSMDPFGVPYGVFGSTGVASTIRNTDENGVAVARFVAGRQNGLASITATAPNAAPGYLPIVLEDAGQEAAGTSMIQGLVIDSAGNPMRNVEVMAILQSATRVWSSFPAITGNDGRYTIINVPVGNINLKAVAVDGNMGMTTVMVGEQGSVVPAPDIVILGP